MTAGINGANDHMAMLMQVLMQGMQKQMQMSKDMVSVSIQNDIAADKMATAQNIIDVYA